MEVRDYSSHHNSFAITQGHFGHHPNRKARIRQNTATEARPSVSSIHFLTATVPEKMHFPTKNKGAKHMQSIWSYSSYLSQTHKDQHYHTHTAPNIEAASIVPCCKKKICLSILKVYLNSTYWPKGVIIRNNKFLYKSVT